MTHFEAENEIGDYITGIITSDIEDLDGLVDIIDDEGDHYTLNGWMWEIEIL